MFLLNVFTAFRATHKLGSILVSACVCMHASVRFNYGLET